MSLWGVTCPHMILDSAYWRLPLKFFCRQVWTMCMDINGCCVSLYLCCIGNILLRHGCKSTGRPVFLQAPAPMSNLQLKFISEHGHTFEDRLRLCVVTINVMYEALAARELSVRMWRLLSWARVATYQMVQNLELTFGQCLISKNSTLTGQWFQSGLIRARSGFWK